MQNSKLSLFVISAIAEAHKNAGNDAFLKGDFVKAINLYTDGIEVKCKDEDLNAKLYNNRASAHYHLGKVTFSLDLHALSKLHFIPYPAIRGLFCIPALIRKQTLGLVLRMQSAG